MSEAGPVRDRAAQGTAMTKKSPTPEDMAIGERVRQLRQAQGITQTTLAEQIGVTFQPPCTGKHRAKNPRWSVRYPPSCRQPGVAGW
jgi:hypothetical protein